MNPEEAARSLATIRQTQAKAITSQTWLPAWFIGGIGLLVTGILVVSEPGTPVPVIVGGGILLLAALGALIAVFAKTRPMTVSDPAMKRAFSAVYLPWLFAGIVLCWVVSFALQAADVPYGMAAGGVALTAYFVLGSRAISRRISRRIAGRVARRFEETR
ncbi:hypothetical protein [Microbispora hainanensis]|uniref:Transmembrane protein n=1 Tax=Microbispora hainanensis TaxID=568844 RepID=A0A544YSX4_9ACTN|nr:hypothetical protein [Microbispora hainanensis]TQS19652.1 hypothetical protein FLX08_19145 [Microbispora hainanensis]